MKVRTTIIITIALIIVISAINFFSDNLTLTSKLPETSIEQARREALQKPFLKRAHRLERHPRLESATSIAQKQLQKVKNSSQKQKDPDGELITTHNSQRLKNNNLAVAQVEKQRAKYHVVPTADGRIYTEWQARVCYYWYKKVKTMYPDSAMGGFTRILHSGKPDNYMDEIPTVVVEALPPGVDQGYPVLNRPWAFVQWVEQYLPSIEEDYILMAEPDHIFVKPPPLWATPSMAAAYPFSYIQPTEHADLISRFNPKNASLEDMATIGNSPVQIHKRQLEKIVHIWYNTSLSMKQDPEADKAFGWILEMYAYSISSAQAEGGPIRYELHRELMAQPPFHLTLDLKGLPVYIIHMTYGMDFNEDGKMVYGQQGTLYHWDKREFVDEYPPKNMPMPPLPISAPTVNYLLSAINEASANLNWPSGHAADQE